MQMKILNTGGTFNKRYNKISGKMEVPFDDLSVRKIVDDFTNSVATAGAIYKDSLEFTTDDRKALTNIIFEDDAEDVFIIIHGTDTMSITAEFLDTIFDDKIIILTGAMIPFEIDKVEASVNLGMAIGYAKACKENGVYICMNGEVQVWNQIEKNRSSGKFELV
jgi:L-asparaginase